MFQDFQRRCAKAGFDVDLGIHLKNMVAFATGQSRFLTVGGLSVEKLQTAWSECPPWHGIRDELSQEQRRRR